MTFFVSCFKCGRDMDVNPEDTKTGDWIFKCPGCGNIIYED